MKILRFDPALHFLVFTHIPKCGGTSVHECLKLMMHDKYIVKTPGVSLASLDANYWGMGGHFNFGGVPPRILNGRQPIYMAIVRHPFSRFVSFYKHVAMRRYHNGHKKVNNFLEMNPIEVLHEWEKINLREISDFQTQMICNTTPEISSVSDAKVIIEHNYKFITTTEHIDYMLNDLADFLGVDKPRLRHLNPSLAGEKSHIAGLLGNVFGKIVTYLGIDGRLHQSHVSRIVGDLNFDDPDLYDEVMRINKKDLALYKYVSKSLHEA